MKEKELDNTYMSEVGDGQKRLSTDPVEVDNGLDAIIVSNVTQTLSGGMTIAQSQGEDSENPDIIIPAGTPIGQGESELFPLFISAMLKQTAQEPQVIIGVATRSFVYSLKPTNISIAKAAHINVDALCDALEESLANIPDMNFDKVNYKKNYISENWHQNLCLTFEQNF